MGRYLMKIVNITALSIIYFVLLIFSIHISAKLPYIKNFPYSGIVYIMLTLIIYWIIYKIILLRNFKYQILTLKFLLLNVTLLVFINLARLLIEPIYCYEFDNGKIIEKYKGGHNYLSFKIKTKEHGILELENFPLEIWNNIEVGDLVKKDFLSKDLIKIK